MTLYFLPLNAHQFHFFSCACPSDFRDMNPTKPGRDCLSIRWGERLHIIFPKRRFSKLNVFPEERTSARSLNWTSARPTRDVLTWSISTSKLSMYHMMFDRCLPLCSFRCECIAPFVNAATSGQIPGSVCALDYCSDVNFCPANSTCRNFEEQVRDQQEWINDFPCRLNASAILASSMWERRRESPRRSSEMPSVCGESIAPFDTRT